MNRVSERMHRRYRTWIASGLGLGLLGAVTGLISSAGVGHHRTQVSTPVGSPYQTALRSRHSHIGSLTTIPYLHFPTTDIRRYQLAMTTLGPVWMTHSRGTSTVWLDPWHGHPHPIFHTIGWLGFYNPSVLGAPWVKGTWLALQETRGVPPHQVNSVWWTNVTTGQHHPIKLPSGCYGFYTETFWGCTTRDQSHQPGILLSETHPNAPPRHLPRQLSVLFAGPTQWLAQWGPPRTVTIQGAEFVQSERLGWYDPASGTFHLKTTVMDRGAPPHFDYYEQLALHPKHPVFPEWKWFQGVLWWPGWGPTWVYVPEDLNLAPHTHPPLRLASVWGHHFVKILLPPDPTTATETAQGANFLVRFSAQGHRFWVGLPSLTGPLRWYPGGRYTQIAVLPHGVIWNVGPRTWFWKAPSLSGG